MSKPKKSKLNAGGSAGDIETIDRKSFTPCWNKLISQHEGLPIKKGSKLVRITKDSVTNDEAESEEHSDNEEDDNAAADDSTKAAPKTIPAVPSEFDFVDDAAVDVEVENLDK